MRYFLGIIASATVLIVFSALFGFFRLFIKTVQANIINDVNEAVYILVGLTPILIGILGIWLTKITWEKTTSVKAPVQFKSNPEKISNNNDRSSLGKAVYTHSKDIATINDYKEKQQTNKTEFTDFRAEDEDKIYEQAMAEIEEDTKVRGTWAKALANSDGNIDKAKSLYIQMRVQSLKIESNKDNIKINHDQDLIRATALAKFTEEYDLYNFKKIDENTYDALQQNNKIIIKYFEGPNRWRFHHRY